MFRNLKNRNLISLLVQAFTSQPKQKLVLKEKLDSVFEIFEHSSTTLLISNRMRNLDSHLSIPGFDNSLKQAPTNLKNFMQDYAKNKKKF